MTKILWRRPAFRSCRWPRSTAVMGANLVGKALKKIRLEGLRLLFIENIGNLICQAEFPLGAKARVWLSLALPKGHGACASTRICFSARIVVINKTDLAAAMEVSVEALAADVHKLKPDVQVIQTSCKTGAGIDEVVAAIQPV